MHSERYKGKEREDSIMPIYEVSKNTGVVSGRISWSVFEVLDDPYELCKVFRALVKENQTYDYTQTWDNEIIEPAYIKPGTKEIKVRFVHVDAIDHVDAIIKGMNIIEGANNAT